MIRWLKKYSLVALALTFLLAPRPGWGFELDTHAAITGEAFDRSAVFDALGDLGVDPARKLSGGSLRGFRSPLAWLVEGVRDEDDTLSTNFARYRNHFYDPVNDRGLTADVVRGEAAPDWALEDRRQFLTQAYSYRDARQAFLAGLTAAAPRDREVALARTFETLGHVIHPLQDMASPPHARNDIHGGFIFGPKSLYERHLNQEQVLARLDFNGMPVRFGLPREYWTTGDGHGLAEFVNRNFVSEGTNFTTRADGSTGGGYPSPVLHLGVDEQGRPFETILDIQTQLEPGLQDRHGNLIAGNVTFFANTFRDPITGEALRNERMTALSLFDRELERKGTSLLFTLNRYNVEAQAAFLIPRAVGYSAGLLDYFFRGRLDVDLVSADESDPSVVRLSGANASPDALEGGTLTLYADDAAGNRSPATAVDPDLTVRVAPDAGVDSARFRAPEDAERFVAVYQGTLGLEARDGTFPGGVIGKVLGGVRVEQVFADGVRWKIRTPRGVFLLPLMVAEFEEVRWGDAENALVARTGFGPGRPNRVAAYEVRREPGSAELATVDTPDGPEVTVTQKNEAVFPFGMSLGTTVHFSQTVEYRQQRLTYEHSSLFRWVAHDPTQPNAGNYEIANDEYGSVQVETAVNEVVPFAESFPLALDLERNAYFGTARNPYVWFLTETAVDASWRLLGVVAVRLRAPQTPGVTRPVLGPPDTPFAVVGMDLVAPWFPSEVDPLLWAIVDLKDGRVVASTAEPTITIVSRRTQETPVWLVPRTTGTIVWEHYFETREGGLRPGHEDSWWGYNIEARPEGRPVREVTEIHVLGDGDLSISVDGWLRGELKDELARHGLYGFQMGSGQTTLEFVYKAAGLRVTSSSSWIEQSPVQFSDARRARPAPGGERLVFMGQGQDDTGTVLVWAPGTASAKVLHQLRSGYHELGPATRATVLVFSKFYEPRERSGFLMPLEGTQAPIVFPGEDLTWSFTLLDPTYLYSVEDLRFYRLRSPLQRTALPARLADVPGRPVGDYHAIRLPGALTP